MKPEIAARHARSVQQWRQEESGFHEPLPFEVPQDYKPDLADCTLFGDSTVDASHFYRDAEHGHRNLKSLLWGLPPGIALALVVVDLTNLKFDETIFGIANWIYALILIALTPPIYFWWKRLPHWANDVFSREDGKMYIYQGEKELHKVLEFYDQHFFALKMKLNYDTYGSLFYVVKDENGKLDYPVRLAKTSSYEEALQAWYFLVRYMDKDWPFDEADQQSLKEIHDYHFKEKGRKFGGILYEDGAREMPGSAE